MIAGLCADFQKVFPDVHIELVLSDRLVDLVGDGFDYAFRIGELPTDLSLVARYIGDYKTVMAASPAYLSRHGIPADTEALKHRRCIRNRN
ncbi:hypothetical protein RCI35_001314 [Enterobacter hormaechei]|nr:hypothetical protein [Enterobacter hormaechei]